ncbi:MAG: hypothetical protein OXF01_19420, partial [Gemmatimonadetes bacterium]|nr:hypothetical protein [Gemmatimonadota bacterium]
RLMAGGRRGRARASRAPCLPCRTGLCRLGGVVLLGLLLVGAALRGEGTSAPKIFGVDVWPSWSRAGNVACAGPARPRTVSNA